VSLATVFLAIGLLAVVALAEHENSEVQGQFPIEIIKKNLNILKYKKN
jgi:hypothetical protein